MRQRCDKGCLLESRIAELCGNCAAHKRALWRNRDPQRRRLKERSFYARHRDRILEAKRVAYDGQAAAEREKQRRWRAARPQLVKAAKRRHYEKAKGQYLAANFRRRRYVDRATPAWANLFFIEEAYRLATLRTKLLGFAWHVDHIVPLRGRGVCGLHVENNLRVIPATLNLKKGNSHAP